MMATYLAGQTVTWAVLHAGLTATGAVFPPELAVGWLATKLTKRFRQPANVALAALGVKLCPALSDLKVSPLVTGQSPQDMANLKEGWATVRKSVEPTIGSTPLDRAETFAGWVQGPADKYGLAYILTAKATSVTTLVGVGAAVHYGLDVQPVMVWLGAGDGMQSTVGCLAAAASANVLFTPLHFIASVKGAQAQDRLAQHLAPIAMEQTKEDHTPGGRFSTEKEWEEAIVQKQAQALFLVWILVTFYAFRVLRAAEGKPPAEDGPAAPPTGAAGTAAGQVVDSLVGAAVSASEAFTPPPEAFAPPPTPPPGRYV